VRLAFRELLLAFRRAPLLGVLGVVTIAFSLFAFGLFGLVSLNVRSALREVEDRVEIRAFLHEGVADDEARALLRSMAAVPAVAEVGYVSPDSALQRARSELQEFRDVMDGAFLPGSVELRLREGQRDPASVAAVSKRLEAFPIVEEVRYGREWVEKLYRLQEIAALAGTALGGVFALVAVIIIGSTIRVSILARTREIEIMRLVGGVTAVALTWTVQQLVNGMLMATHFFSGSQIAGGIAAGGLLGLIVSWLSVGRHLKGVWRD
jgi:cell division transport system permease protein